MFQINIAKGIKKHKVAKPTIISRRCRAVVIKENDKFVAKIKLKDDLSQYPDTLVIPFTPESYELKRKEYIFSLNKDKYNHYVCVIRSAIHAFVFPGDPNKFSPFKPDMVVVGNIVRINGKTYFEYTKFVSFNENQPDYNPISIDESKPLFK